MTTPRKISLLGFGFALALAACAKPPTQELADAENAINAAIQAGAEEFASTELKTAQDALSDANAKVESKDYKAAKAAALDAKTKADAAAQAVEPGKQAAKADAEAKMAGLKSEIEAALDKAGKLKGKGLEAVRAEAAALAEEWRAAQADFAAGSYKLVTEKTAAAGEKLSALKAAVESAKKAAAPKGRKKK